MVKLNKITKKSSGNRIMKKLTTIARGSMDCDEFVDAYLSGSVQCSFDDELMKLVKETTDYFIENGEECEECGVYDIADGAEYMAFIYEYNAGDGSDFNGVHFNALTKDVKKYLLRDVIEEEGGLDEAVDTVWSYISEGGEFSPTLLNFANSEIQRLQSLM